MQWRHTALANISHQKHTYWAFFNGGISKHQAQINQNEAKVFFAFWITKLQLHFIGSVNRKVNIQLSSVLSEM